MRSTTLVVQRALANPLLDEAYLFLGEGARRRHLSGLAAQREDEPTLFRLASDKEWRRSAGYVFVGNERNAFESYGGAMARAAPLPI